MDVKKLFECCKSGDLNRVKELVQQKDVELNVRDKWDSTPLYYACLCGHTNLVRFLLKSGARCEANTFDGERCVYGSLTPEIRNILLNYKVITSKIIQRNDFDEFLRKSFESGDYFDVIFSVHKEIFKCHRCLLSARCEYFNEMFHNKWKSRKIIYLNNARVHPLAFKILLQYLYTGRLEMNVDFVDDVKLLVKQCQLNKLLEQIDDAEKRIRSFACTKPGTNVTTILVESYTQSNDFSIIVEHSLPPEFHSWIDGTELPFLPNFADPFFSDIMFKIENKLFKCHKLFFCGRSDFFKALVDDHFLEAQEQIDGIQVFTMHDISVDAFVGLVSYLYQNQVQFNQDNIYELLVVSDLYLLPGLKRQCANYIGHHLNKDNVISMLRSSRLMQLKKLETSCTEFIAHHLEDMISNEEFCSIVREDAKEVKERQETDTIDIIDDIRYHITSNVLTFSEMSEANEKLAMIDELLESMDLDA